MFINTDCTQYGSIEPSSTITETPQNCLVCSRKANGARFGVPVCRPCAAFYRCRREDHESPCDFARNTDRKVVCKHCRFDKCLKVGMKAENIKYVVRLPELDAYRNAATPDTITMRNIVASKTKVLNDRIDCIFSQELLPNLHPNSLLYHLEQSLLKKRAAVSRNSEVINIATLKTFWPLQNDQKCLIAEWMMDCPEFARLSRHDKWLIFMAAWQQIYILEKIQLSVELFGERVITESLLISLNGFHTNRKTFKLDTSVISDHDQQYVHHLLNPFKNTDEVIKNIFVLHPTSTETAYMLTQLMWNIEEVPVSSGIIPIADRVRERLSDEIHRYYVEQVGLVNYADRMNRLMNIVHTVKSLIDAHNEMIEVASIFNVLKI